MPMEPIKKSARLTPTKPTKNRYLHSPNHLLADELSVQLNDRKHFGFYLKIAGTYDHNFLRGLVGQILENKNAKTPGRLFAYLIKQHNESLKNPK